MSYPTSPALLGVDFTEQTADARFKLGTKVQDEAGTVWQYVKASASGNTKYLLYPILASFVLSANGTAYAAANCGKLAAPQATLTASYYGWVAIQGPMTVSTAAAVTAFNKTYTSATAGEIDDASSSQNEIVGLYVLTDPGTAGDASCVAAVELFYH